VVPCGVPDQGTCHDLGGLGDQLHIDELVVGGEVQLGDDTRVEDPEVFFRKPKPLGVGPSTGF
jgi:hypothetical protein